MCPDRQRDRGPVPRGRHERRERAHRKGHRATRHPPVVRLHDRRRCRRPDIINLTLRRASSGCAAFPNAAVYAWHCDAIGQYSLYSIETENYLRGVQVADAKGVVSFLTTFPGAYPGRWPHVHFEVYADLASATLGRNAIKTSQLALPEATCKAVYAGPGYDGSATNLASTPLARDSQFRDGWATQMPTVSGDVKKGFSTNLVVNV